ncbi:MAG: hypothetical protein OXK74_15095 [Gemmatimonadota bacterium]|nr:hypothetical protein [Gemmatimonadota bacterium]
MARHRVSRIPMSLPIVALALAFAGCAEDRRSDPALISLDSGEVTWESTEGALWGIADVLAGDRMIWVLSPVEPFVHGLQYGAEMVAFGTQGDGPGEFRSATALLPLGEAGEITVWDAASRLYRTFAADGLWVANRGAGEVGTVRGDIDVVTFGDPLRVAVTAEGGTVRGEFAGAVMSGSDLWTATLVHTGADGNVERLVDFGDLRGAFHEEVRTRSVLVPVPLWDACPDGSVVVLDPMARFLYRIDSTWEERDSLFVPWDVPPLTRADRISYLKGQLNAELQGRRVEDGEMEAMLARAEEGGRDQFPASAPLAVDLKCSEGRVWMQEYDGAAHPLGFSQTWRTVALAGDTQPYSEVTLPPAFQLFRVSDAHLLGVVTDDMDLQRVASIPLPESLRPFVRDGSRPVSATAPEMRVALGTAPDDAGSGRLKDSPR